VCSSDLEPRAEAVSERGMSSLRREEFEGALLELVAPWLGSGKTLAVVCGMAGARQGWIEAPYRSVPCAPLGDAIARPEVRDPRLDVAIVPGLKQQTPPDVIRGEETQIGGLLAARPRFDGVICLPGTHTKWAEISAGEVVSFRSFMTGELFGLLAQRSVLRHSLDAEWSEEAFAEAVEEAIARPEALAARLFTLRAEALLSAPVPGRARARLSGLLVGAELAAARPYWLGREIVIVGSGELARGYAAALAAQGVVAPVADATRTTLAGLYAARSHLGATA